MLDVIQPTSSHDLVEITDLFGEYAAWLSLETCSHNIAQEVAELPGQYGPPDGHLLLARQNNQPAGCVALRKFEPGICEMKRLHVRPAFRGQGIGRALAVAIISEARRLAYRKMRLDSIADRMIEAISLYKKLGFRQIEPYGVHAERCTTFMELELSRRP